MCPCTAQGAAHGVALIGHGMVGCVQVSQLEEDIADMKTIFKEQMDEAANQLMQARKRADDGALGLT